MNFNILFLRFNNRKKKKYYCYICINDKNNNFFNLWLCPKMYCDVLETIEHLAEITQIF